MFAFFFLIFRRSSFQYSRPEIVQDFKISCGIQDRKHSFVILLGGTSGCGKSTLASLLASRYACEFLCIVGYVTDVCASCEKRNRKGIILCRLCLIMTVFPWSYLIIIDHICWACARAKIQLWLHLSVIDIFFQNWVHHSDQHRPSAAHAARLCAQRGVTHSMGFYVSDMCACLCACVVCACTHAYVCLLLFGVFLWPSAAHPARLCVQWGVCKVRVCSCLYVCVHVRSVARFCSYNACY